VFVSYNYVGVIGGSMNLLSPIEFVAEEYENEGSIESVLSKVRP
jgi:hypothetical protein